MSFSVVEVLSTIPQVKETTKLREIKRLITPSRSRTSFCAVQPVLSVKAACGTTIFHQATTKWNLEKPPFFHGWVLFSYVHLFEDSLSHHFSFFASQSSAVCIQELYLISLEDSLQGPLFQLPISGLQRVQHSFSAQDLFASISLLSERLAASCDNYEMSSAF